MDKCCQDKCCLDKCHLLQLESVHGDLLNLRVKFCQNRITNSWDFGEGSSSSSCCCCCCSCDGGKTKSTLCPTWTELLSLDWSLTTIRSNVPSLVKIGWVTAEMLLILLSLTHVWNFRSVEHFSLVDFGGGSSCSCDGGKTKSTRSLTNAAADI